MIESSTWRSFDELESYLTLDELLLLLKCIQKRTRSNYRMLAALQGIELDPDPEDIPDKGDADLPKELLEMEQRRKERIEKEKPEEDQFKDFQLGYSKAFDQLDYI